MAKVYDMVQTSKMAMETTSSLITVDKVAKTDLENGRLVAVDADGTIRYALTTDSKVFLHASVEKMAELFRGLTEFKKLTGDYVRVLGMLPLDRFITTAVDATGIPVAGDTVTVGANGTLKKIASPVGTEVFLAKVLEVTSIGYDRITAYRVEVIKA